MRYAFGFIVVLLVSGCVYPRPGNKFGVLSPIERIIREWQEDNNLNVSEEAIRLLVDQAGVDCANCTATYHRQAEGAGRPVESVPETDTNIVRGEKVATKRPSVTEQQRSWQPIIASSWGAFQQALYEYYLDQLRDFIIDRQRKLIGTADVKAFSFATFVKGLGWGDGPSLPVGRLILRSEPKGASITINDKRRGYTDKRFVVEQGRYEVRIDQLSPKFSCKQSVNIREFDMVTLVCTPPK